MSIPQTITDYADAYELTDHQVGEASLIAQAILDARSAERVHDPTERQITDATALSGGALDRDDAIGIYRVALRQARLCRAFLLEWVQSECRAVDPATELGCGLAVASRYLDPTGMEVVSE